MIRWADKLYLGESIEGRKEKVMKSVESGKLTYAIFCITYASNPDNLLDIISANELSFPYYQKKEIHIIGLAGSKSEARELVRVMIEEIYRETGGFSVKEYF
ncbi:hypothetical protein [Anaerocolumna xylanovorans]|uniref:Uncharacterized protein n=1 Tax=Anaerocolumna xylanovorans DSM 12503 TaxID=1121345 RepID=A0A1M7YCH8_9FIRM|nr:hypothetical protein [Anaerocolumna xylanovorans]SHO50344.1 hypothetical protein SAMN02745217_02716 [Anaerocolumna xylanovorans DSM 12503]